MVLSGDGCLSSQGIQTHPSQVLITSGSQQGLALVCQALLKPGDVLKIPASADAILSQLGM